MAVSSYLVVIASLKRLAADVGEAEATIILEREWRDEIPKRVIEAGLIRKAR